MAQVQDFRKPRSLVDSLFQQAQLPTKGSSQHFEFQIKDLETIKSRYSEHSGEALAKDIYSQHRVSDAERSQQIVLQGELKDKKLLQETVLTPLRNSSKGRPGNFKAKSSNPIPKDDKEVNIDEEIGEVAEWGERGTKHNEDQENFQEEEVMEKIKETEDHNLRKKIEEKISNANEKRKGSTGQGLKAKAEELKRLNQQAQSLPKETQSLNKNGTSPAPLAAPLAVLVEEEEHPSSLSILTSVKKINRPSEASQSSTKPAIQEEDPWEKINQETLSRCNKKAKVELTYQVVIGYYKNFEYVAEDYEDLLSNHEEQQSCFEVCFPCLQKERTENNRSVALRLLAIAKQQLTNSEEQLWLLKDIWEMLTGEKFLRYGNHWNQIGFQGRDPATDLRSTGMLSLVQWYCFIKAHSVFARKVYNWTIQFEFPLALTHIKTTGQFLEQLQRGQITGGSWDDFQVWYNSLAYCKFVRVMKDYRADQPVGELAEMKLDCSECRRTYQQWSKK